jgi:hypothetical protein
MSCYNQMPITCVQLRRVCLQRSYLHLLLLHTLCRQHRTVGVCLTAWEHASFVAAGKRAVSTAFGSMQGQLCSGLLCLGGYQAVLFGREDVLQPCYLVCWFV